MQGNLPEPIEAEGRADILVALEGVPERVVVECKRLQSVSENRINAEVRDANRQIKAEGNTAPGVAVFDVTEGLESTRSHGLNQRVTQLASDVKRAISGAKNRSVSAVVLIWDEFQVVPGEGGKTETLFHRKWDVLRHSGPRVTIPETVEIYEGYTVYSALQWIPTAPGSGGQL